MAPHAATALLQNYLISDPHWYPVSSRPTGIRYGETYSQAAAVRTVCTRKVLTFSNTTFLVSLPDPPAFDLWARASHRSGKHTDIKLAKPLWGTQKGAHTNKTGLTTVWIPPTSDMESVTAGLVVLSALNSSSATERFAVVCSIDARWNKAKHVLTVKGSNPAVLGNKASDSSSSDVSIVQSSKHDNRALASTVLPINDGSSWRHIAAEQAWLDGLTPLVPQWMDETKTARNKSTMTTAFANLFIATDARLRTDRPKKTMEKYWIQNIETVTSTAMADAISRIGLGRQYWSNKHYTGSGNKCTGIVGAAPRQFCPGPPPYGESSLLTFQGFLTGEWARICVYILTARPLSHRNNTFPPSPKNPPANLVPPPCDLQATPTKPPASQTTSPCSSCSCTCWSPWRTRCTCSSPRAGAPRRGIRWRKCWCWRWCRGPV